MAFQQIPQLMTFLLHAGKTCKMSYPRADLLWFCTLWYSLISCSSSPFTETHLSHQSNESRTATNVSATLLWPFFITTKLWLAQLLMSTTLNFSEPLKQWFRGLEEATKNLYKTQKHYSANMTWVTSFFFLLHEYQMCCSIDLSWYFFGVSFSESDSVLLRYPQCSKHTLIISTAASINTRKKWNKAEKTFNHVAS